MNRISSGGSTVLLSSPVTAVDFNESVHYEKIDGINTQTVFDTRYISRFTDR